MQTLEWREIVGNQPVFVRNELLGVGIKKEELLMFRGTLSPSIYSLRRPAVGPRNRSHRGSTP